MIIQNSAVIAIAAIWQPSSFPFHPINLPCKGPAYHSHAYITVVPLVVCQANLPHACALDKISSGELAATTLPSEMKAVQAAVF